MHILKQCQLWHKKGEYEAQDLVRFQNRQYSLDERRKAGMGIFAMDFFLWKKYHAFLCLFRLKSFQAFSCL